MISRDPSGGPGPLEEISPPGRDQHQNGTKDIREATEPAAALPRHHAPEPPPQGAADKQGASSNMERAEEMVDHLAVKIGSLAAACRAKLSFLAAYARTQAQDIWAEAQKVRRGKKP